MLVLSPLSHIQCMPLNQLINIHWQYSRDFTCIVWLFGVKSIRARLFLNLSSLGYFGQHDRRLWLNRNIKAGFRVTGLWPIDENAIPDEKYTGDAMYSESNVDSTSESDTFESDYDNDTNDCKLDMRIECSNWLFN